MAAWLVSNTDAQIPIAVEMGSAGEIVLCQLLRSGTLVVAQICRPVPEECKPTAQNIYACLHHLLAGDQQHFTSSGKLRRRQGVQ